MFKVILLSLLAVSVPRLSPQRPHGTVHSVPPTLCLWGTGLFPLGLGPAWVPTGACGAAVCVSVPVSVCAASAAAATGLGQPAWDWVEGLLPKMTRFCHQHQLCFSGSTA